MTYDRFLALAGNWAAILTAIVALAAYGSFLWNRRDRRLRLEEHLKNAKDNGPGLGQRSTLHLMRYLRMTEAEVLEAALHSKNVQLRTDRDQDGRAINLWFEFGTDAGEPDDIYCTR